MFQVLLLKLFPYNQLLDHAGEKALFPNDATEVVLHLLGQGKVILHLPGSVKAVLLHQGDIRDRQVGVKQSPLHTSLEAQACQQSMKMQMIGPERKRRQRKGIFITTFLCFLYCHFMIFQCLRWLFWRLLKVFHIYQITC